MNELFYIFLFLSLAGSLLALILFSLNHLLKDRISKTWQYYIWIIVIARLLIPYTPHLDIVEEIFNQASNYMMTESQTQNMSNN